MKKFFMIFVALVSLGLIFWSCSGEDDGGTTEPTNVAPTCAITSPAPNTGYNSGETIQIKVNAEDSDGSIEEVRFYVDGVGVASVQTFPYDADIATTDLVIGEHIIRVVAEDDDATETELDLQFGIKPLTPTNLNVIQNNVYTFTLNWTDANDGEDGFVIERKIDNGAFAEITTTTETTFIDSTISKKGYSSVAYQVKVFKGIYNSDYVTNSYSILFPAPYNLVYTKEDLNTIKLDWQETSTGEDGFKIDKKIGLADWVLGYANIGENITTWTDSNAEINESLQYRIHAFKGLNSSDSVLSNIDNTFPAPTNLTTTQIDLTTASIEWTDNSFGEEKFEIERKLSTETTYVKVGEVTGSDTSTKSWSDTTVEPAKIYDYRVMGIKEVENSIYVTKTNYNNEFQAPTTLIVDQNNVYTFTLNWTDNSTGEDGFKIERKIDDGDFVEIASVTDINYVDSNVYKGYGTVYYQVRGYKGAYYSAYATQNSAVDFPAPTNFTYSKINLNTIKMDWLETSNGEDGFKIDKKIGLADWIINHATVGENIKTWTDINAEINENLTYRVYAYKGTNATATIGAYIINIFPTPTNLTVNQVNLTSATVTWTDNSIGEEKFEIERKLSTETTYAKVAELTGDDTGTKTWNDIGLEPTKIYDYRVRGVKGSSNSAYTQKTFENTFPAPTALTVNQNNVYTFTLNWADNSIGEDGFRIERKIDDGAYSEIMTTTATSFVDSTVAKKGYGTVYYQVRAYKDTYYSAYAVNSSAVSFPAPTGLIYAKENIFTIKLDWTDNSTGEDGFKIDKKVGTGEWIVEFASLGSNIQTWTDSNAEINENITYRVYAYKGTNTTTSIETATIDNTFPAPTELTISQVSLTEARLVWRDNSIGEEKFDIERKLSTETIYVKVDEITGSDINMKSWNDTNFEPTSIYDYQIKAVKSVEYSEYVQARKYETLLTPTGLAATTTSVSSIKLNWIDNNNFEQGFKIDRKDIVSGDWIIDYTTVGANITEWEDNGLIDETTYYYRIRAYSLTYNSNYTNEVKIVPAPSGLVFVPSGSFSMGQPDPNIGSTNWTADEQPVHDVNITRKFYLGKYETTQQEWIEIMGTNPAFDYGVGDDYPVYYVSWYSVLKYCNLRSISEGLTSCYTINGSTDPSIWGSVPDDQDDIWNAVVCDLSVNGYRLPTESEWEYAAKYNDGRTYPWGEDTPSSNLCNYNSNIGSTTIVGSYPEGNSNLGLCDMAGNVREWVWDRHVTYPSGEQTDPLGATSGDFRVMRGGAWYNFNTIDNYKIRCTARFNVVPYHDGVIHDMTLGFRIARTK
ncbi:MAG: SUMF1/EgtB/PvdO family nonheme iron enzyme [Candidatus Delongbacteria bacterium]|jgi:formylglycine-generating enzyme required for sulfatase activity|nr:SUMF1/EgtB/PvdO family nonheme iron enzyme [Candidatus Delongbacteria bacterium]